MPIGYAVLLTAIAEAFGKELAKNVGAGIVETLFRQQAIARDLEEIKRLLLVIANFLATKLPGIVYDQSKRAGADLIQMEVVEIVDTVVGSTAILKEKRIASSPARFDACSELDAHVERLFEKAGVLRTYGQIYYASVSVALLACLVAYAEMVEVEPVRFKALAVRLNAWKAQLPSWLDTSSQGSLGWIDRTLDADYELAARLLHEMDSRVVGHETRYLLGWQRRDYPADPDSGTPATYAIQTYGCWFYYDGESVVGDEPLGAVYSLPNNSPTTRAQVMALAIRDRYYDPAGFYRITDGYLGYRPAFDAAAARLSQMVEQVKAYPSLSPPAKSAVSQVKAMVDAINKALDNPIAQAVL